MTDSAIPAHKLSRHFGDKSSRPYAFCRYGHQMHSFERLAQIGDPASIASLRVASSSLAVMKMTGHFDPDAASRRCSSIPEIPQVNVKQ